jgi:hypothetical protein
MLYNCWKSGSTIRQHLNETICVWQLLTHTYWSESVGQQIYTCILPAKNIIKWNKGNAKRGVSTRLTIWPCDLDLWHMTLQINRVPDSLKDYKCTKFGQNPLKDVDSRVFTRMLCSKKLTPWPLTLKINRVPDSHKD